MTYIAIRRDAAQEIIAERELQSTDFEAGAGFAEAIQKLEPINVSPRISSSKVGDDFFIYGRDNSDKQYVVIDIEQSHILVNQSAQNVMLFLQRILRFAIKYWGRGILTPAERVVGATTAAIFPFPLSQKTGVRITVDLNPDKDRLSKRGRSGRYMLVYKLGRDEGNGASEKAGLSAFRRFLAVVEGEKVRSFEASQAVANDDLIAGLKAVSLSELPSKVDLHQQYEVWLRLLTNDQKRFVLAPLVNPARINGPAGTGKTLSLALAALHNLKVAQETDQELQAIFFTHSEASRRNITNVLQAMGASNFIVDQATIRRLRIETLQGYCASILRQDLAATEFVDPDAYDAKQLQRMYVEEAMRCVDEEFETYARFITPELKNYWESEENSTKASLLQHEISVVIKGRSGESIDCYKKLPSIKNGIPIHSEEDKGFIWRIYENYREQLVSGGQFDTDDVVLTALSQLSTPIWRRRRSREGFDAIYVDETHLFNMNELSVFHHLTRSELKFPIAFAVDRSQAIGDRGWVDDVDVTSLMPTETARMSSTTVNMNGIFRSAPNIVNLAFMITSSGASLFTNFQDPMRLAHSNMTHDEEKKTRVPSYIEFVSDPDMIEKAFTVAETMRSSISSSRGEIAIVAFSDYLFRLLLQQAEQQNKPIEVLKHRGDYDLVRRAQTTGRFVLSMPDYVGGLEFDGVVLVGVDEGRVPPSTDNNHSQSRAYMNFASHNRLYVAVTRARYQVAILGVKERGPSKLLTAALAADALQRATDR